MAASRYVTLEAKNPDIKVTALLGKEAPTVTEGYGGWEVVPRPKSPPVTLWKGGNAFRMRLPLLLDGWIAGKSVEQQRENLEQLGREAHGGNAPPVVNVHIPGGVPRSSRVDWVIEDIDWQEELRRDSDGLRVRIWAMVTLLEYIDPDNITILKRSRNTKKYTIYVTKTGDTLKKIATKKLKKASRWREIAKLNHLRDPNKVIKKGTKIKIPPMRKPKSKSKKGKK